MTGHRQGNVKVKQQGDYRTFRYCSLCFLIQHFRYPFNVEPIAWNIDTKPVS